MASQLKQDQRNNVEILENLIIQCNMLKKCESLEILQSVLSCDEKRVKEKGSSLINVFQLDNDDEENHSVELAILRAFLNSRKKEYYKNLRLALQWNRVDIAKMDIFTGEEVIEASDLSGLLKKALINNSPEFVELFLEFVDLESFLTVGQLEEFYNDKSIKDSDKHNPLFKLYPFENNEKTITSAGLKRFFKEHFFDDFEVMFLPDNLVEGDNDPVKFPAKNL
jgi:hypothetical protein